MKIERHSQWTENLKSVKVSFQKRSHGLLVNILIGIDICDDLDLEPGDRVIVRLLNDNKCLKIEKCFDDTRHTYKIQDIKPKTRNNYRIQFTWHFSEPDDWRMSIVDHSVFCDQLTGVRYLKINLFE